MVTVEAFTSAKATAAAVATAALAVESNSAVAATENAENTMELQVRNPVAEGAEKDTESIKEKRKRKKKHSKNSKDGEALEVESEAVESESENDKGKKKKKNRQTSQEEESAQALLALNKGLAGIDEEDEAEEQDGNGKKKKRSKVEKKEKKKKKREAKSETFVVEDYDETTDAPSQQTDSTGAGVAPPEELLDGQRIVSQHLAAHMSKLAAVTSGLNPPPLATATATLQLGEEPIDPTTVLPFLTATATVPGVITGDHALEMTFQPQSLVPPNPIPSKPKSKTAAAYEKKRKRLAEDEANRLVDPALMELDEAAAAAAAAAVAAEIPPQPASEKRKRRKLPEKDNESTKSPKKAPRKKSSEASSGDAGERASSVGGGAVGGGSNGTFTKEERHAIDTHLAAYAEQHNLSQQDLCSRVWSNERKKDDFWESVCAVLPLRSRASIYKHVRRAYHIFEQRAKWTDEEDEELARLVKELGSSWKRIGSAMGRMGEDCRDRWRNYGKCGKDRGKDRWDAEEEEELKRVVGEMLERVRERRRAEGKEEDNAQGDDEEINWTVVSDQMGNRRSRIQCRYKWNKMKQQRARVGLMGNGGTGANMGGGSNTGKRRKLKFDIANMTVGDNIWLLKQIRDSGATEESQINWDDIANLDTEIGVWSGKDFQSAYKSLRASTPHKRRPLAEIVKQLLLELEDLPIELRSTRYYPPPSLLPNPSPPVDLNPPTSFEAANDYSFLPAHAPVANMAPVAAMDPAYEPQMLVDVRMVDPELIGQGIDPGVHQELEKTAGEAIAYSNGLLAAAQAEATGEEEGEEERELRRRLGGVV
ncbi:RNA polymerase I enhancer binding protein [Rhizina undulata]